MLRNGTNGYSDNRARRPAREIRSMRVYMSTRRARQNFKTCLSCTTITTGTSLCFAVGIRISQRRF